MPRSALLADPDTLPLQRIRKAGGVALALAAAMLAADWQFAADIRSAEGGAMAVVIAVAQIGIVGLVAMLVLLESD